MNYSLNWLQSQFENNHPVEYLFFWGHTQKKQGVIDKSCLSQWFPALFTVDDINYPTTEHWMMAKKAELFNDRFQYENVLTTASPAKAKKFGRAIKNFDEMIWKNNAYRLVVEGNKHKFSQQDEMKTFILNTGNSVLVEASPFDKIWGIGTRTHEADPLKWKGANLLGFALMEVREFLRCSK